MTLTATTSILPNQHGSEGEEERRILADGVDGVGDNNVDHACDMGDPTAGNGERNQDDEDGVLSPEDLLLKAVASSALRSNSLSREDAEVLLAAQQSGQPQPLQLNTSTTAPTTITTAADKVDHDSANTINSNNNESTSNNKIAASNSNDNDSSISPPPPGLPTRDRHVALPGAFSSPGPAYPRTPHDDFYDEEVAEATVSAASNNNNNNSNNHNNALLPTLEATLVMESASTIRDDNNELVQAAVLVSKEESLTPSPMDEATRKKRLLCWGVLAAVVLLVVVGFTVVLTIKLEDDRFLERNETNMQPNLDDDESKSTESDDADNVHSASRSLRGLDCSITHCGP